MIPAGELITVPVPVPAKLTDSWNRGIKVAVTVIAELTVTLQAPVPVQAPPQPVNTDPAAAIALSVTAVPDVNVAEHVAPQLIPAGLLVTVPAPAPWGISVSENCGLKFAVTFWAELIVTLQAPVPVHAPLQPVKTDPAAGDSARLTTVPEL